MRASPAYAAHGGLRKRRIAVSGLVFKTSANDLREAPSLVPIAPGANDQFLVRCCC